jgi:hypothetical protein
MPKWEGVETVLFYMDWVEGKLAVLHKWPDTTKLGTGGSSATGYNADLSVESEPHSGRAK